MKANAPNIDELIEAAADRDTVALSRLYGQAAAWIKAGKAPPEPLAGWIADRMQGLAESLHQHTDRKKTEPAAARALMIRRDKKAAHRRERRRSWTPRWSAMFSTLSAKAWNHIRQSKPLHNSTAATAART